ncbi:MAG: TetR/AcrR family transcriptional regulator [Chloroflexota bacterium]
MDTPTHKALLKAVQDIILEYGFEGATTKRIAERAGVNEVTLFRHFGSKTNLLQAALRSEAELFEQIAVDYTGDLETDLLNLATAHFALVRQQGPLLMIAYFEVARQPELAGLLDGQMVALQKVIDLFARYQERGVLRPIPPEVALVRFIGPLVFASYIQHGAPGFLELFKNMNMQDFVSAFLDGHRVDGPLGAEDSR